MKPIEPENRIITCMIVDDEEASVKELTELLKEHKEVKLLAAESNPYQAIPSIIKHKPELLFLDVQMPGMDGFGLLETLSHTDVKPVVIFVTAFDKYAIQALRAAAFDYLLKPLERHELAQTLERYINLKNHPNPEEVYSRLLEQTGRKKLKLNTNCGFTLIDPQDIVYIQADWNYSEIYFSKEKHDVVTMNLSAVESMLPKGCFARINRSVIVNLSYLDKVQRTKHKCTLKKDGVTYEFNIPIIRIRFLENLF